MDIDYAIRKDEPPTITETSIPDAIDLYEKWERSNRLSMMFIKTKISAGIRGSVEQHNKVKDLLKAIDEQFATSDKALASTLIMQFSSMKLIGIKGVRDHIMHMRDIAAQLEALEVKILSYESKVIGYGTLIDGLYSIELQNDAAYNSMHITAGLKRCVVNEESSMLWHRRLGHISIKRIKRLVNEGVLSTLNFADFETCIDCIKGKQTNKSKKGAKRSTNLLEIIHTDICCPDMDIVSPKYFVTFIDDYSRYMYLYLLRSKDKTLDAFKIFKAEVENQCGKQIKIVRSDRGGEYYGRYTESGQAPGPFAKFLQEHGIVAQHTMPGSPDQNGVAERRNRTLMDMVFSVASSNFTIKKLRDTSSVPRATAAAIATAFRPDLARSSAH
ncbi:uncharacterized protein LOC110031568 [Phalaenopsis equestris]|uniref:uncharacterized protein LOC110031568 n=1 Tax=Phalaenopsis equestris TaxID=78828 RepID=UPI0009E59053|nr:uncharacterized protein LOC110031568 [Phalaenopsis equestris]